MFNLMTYIYLLFLSLNRVLFNNNDFIQNVLVKIGKTTPFQALISGYLTQLSMNYS